jgi:hypothetical protein
MSLFKITFADVQNARKNKNPDTKAHVVTGDIVEGTLENSTSANDSKILQRDDRRGN